MLRDIRKQYILASLDEESVLKNPLEQFQKWLQDALNSEQLEPTAMVLSTVDSTGQPHSRIVLLKEFIHEKFVFFTNYEGHKGHEIAQNQKVSLNFFWPSLERQVRVEGVVDKIGEANSTSYFQSRPIDSQLGAWASPQSQVIHSADFLEKQFEHYKLKYGNQVPKPPYWGGYSIKAHLIEFWQGRPNRLHDRLLFTRHGDEWVLSRLAP